MSDFNAKMHQIVCRLGLRMGVSNVRKTLWGNCISKGRTLL